jgi:hypothetical protein
MYFFAYPFILFIIVIFFVGCDFDFDYGCPVFPAHPVNSSLPGSPAPSPTRQARLL